MEMQSTAYLSAASQSLSGEQFLGQYRLKSLTDEDFKEMWRRYDPLMHKKKDVLSFASILTWLAKIKTVECCSSPNEKAFRCYEQQCTVVP